MTFISTKKPKGQVAPSSEVLAQGSVHAKNAFPLPTPILVERDVQIPLRDGARVFADVYRPVGDAAAPAIVAWGPYGKDGGLAPPLRDPTIVRSGLQAFEAPDPGYWVPHGYAVVYVDIRGSHHCDGRLHFWGTQDGRDGYDVTEWLAAQPWSNGRIGFSGNSWLSVSQFFIAAEQPPHLAAIAPWEGFSDIYRDLLVPGGIPMSEFTEAVLGMLRGDGLAEDLPAMAARQPLMTAYWKDKVADLSKISLPAYFVSSYANKVHTRGTIHAFNGIASEAKWLRIHADHEWADYYRNQDDLRRFFDRYLLDVANDWESTPRVRMSILDPGRRDVVDRPESAFPPATVVTQRLHLNPATIRLETAAPVTPGTVSFVADDNHSRVAFVRRFETSTVVAGFMVLELWVELDGADDVDLFVEAQKLDAQGREQQIIVRGAPYSGRRGAPYRWGNGVIRLSHRKLGPSRHGLPYLAHDELQLVGPGEIVSVQIEIPPMAMRFDAGDQLRFLTGGFSPQDPELPIEMKHQSHNKGRVIIHGGGMHDSHLSVPVLPD